MPASKRLAGGVKSSPGGVRTRKSRRALRVDQGVVSIPRTVHRPSLLRRSPEALAVRTTADPAELAELLASRRRVTVLTGAGASTDSGIPDYRDADGTWKGARPMLYRDFVGSAANRRRYWARSMVGWRRIAEARPNAAHRALARLERAGRVHPVITQNVDGLHQKAGSRRVIDLHGRLDRVECLECRMLFGRSDFQKELHRLNPGWLDAAPSADAPAAPDGDALLEPDSYDGFRVPHCPCCAGDLKPWVVFFGERVPKGRTARAFAAVDEADALLVVGSSLMVWSGYRFARRAAERGTPLALLNLGATRADGEATLKIEAPCGEALEAVAETLLG